MASLRPTISTVSTVISSDDVIQQLVGSAKPNVVEQVLNCSEIKSLMATLLKLEKSSTTSPATKTTKSRTRPVYPKKSKRKKKNTSKQQPPPDEECGNGGNGGDGAGADGGSGNAATTVSSPITVDNKELPTTPLLSAAQERLKSIHNKDLREIKAFRRPPEDVKSCVYCVLILLRAPTLTWEAA